MRCIPFASIAFLPSILFTLLSLPVERKRIIQEAALTVLWITNLLLPVLFAGTCQIYIMISIAVYTWATGLKMAVWLFCMPMEERRKRSFFGTLWYWRERTRPKNTSIKRSSPEPPIVSSNSSIEPPRRAVSLTSYLKTYVQHQLLFETLEYCVQRLHSQQTIDVYDYGLRALSFTLRDPVQWRNVVSSLSLCVLFSIYLQVQLQVTYDAFLVIYGLAYHVLSFLGISAQWTRTVKEYVEEVVDMPPAFDSPWEATSLRDYW